MYLNAYRNFVGVIVDLDETFLGSVHDHVHAREITHRFRKPLLIEREAAPPFLQAVRAAQLARQTCLSLGSCLMAAFRSLK